MKDGREAGLREAVVQQVGDGGDVLGVVVGDTTCSQTGGVVGTFTGVLSGNSEGESRSSHGGDEESLGEEHAE